MSENPDDPFDLQGKNLRRVIPQVHKSIRIQRARVIGHIVTLCICLMIGTFGCRTTGMFLLLGFVCFVMSPFALIGIFADRHLMHWHQRRLAECERLLKEQESSK